MRLLLPFASLLFLASCSGGGCSGSLPADATPIDNAAAVRISRPGLDFLEGNLGTIAAAATNATGGVLSVGIPETPIQVPNLVDVGTCPLCIQLSLTGSICPGGPDPATKRCTATVDLGAATFQLDAITPSSVKLAAVLPLSLADTAVTLTVAPVPSVTVHVAYGAGATCTGTKQDTPSVQPRALPVTITIPLVADVAAPHATKVDIDGAVIDLSQVAAADIAVCADCGPFTFPAPGGGSVNVCNSVLDAPALKTALVTQLRTGLDAQLKTLLRDRVPAMLGTSSHVDLASLAGAFSPGTTGGIDLGLVPFGPMSPAPGLPVTGGRTANGITIAMLGGAVASPLSRCVTPANVAPPAGIPVPDELVPTVADPAGTSHVGVAVSGRFLEFTATKAYDSGLFCLGTSTAEVSLLKVSILSLLVPSLKTLTFERGDAAAAIATRPGAPPKITVGTSPLLLLTLPRFAVDFYVWSFDRYARVFTYTADLAIPVDLTAGAAGMTPVIGDVKVTAGAVTNSDRTLFEDPAVVGGAVGALFGTLVKQLVGSSSSPIDLGAALAPYGLALDVATIGKLTKGDDAFVGVFGNLKSTVPGGARGATEAMATLSAKRVFADHLQLGTYDRAFLPELEVDLAASDDAAEYSWWIDRGTRSAWARDRHVVIKDDQLLAQGQHTLHVVARRIGEPASEDPTPVAIPYVIDAVPPVVAITGNAVRAWDLVSTELAGRVRVGEGAFGAWQPVASLVVPAGRVEVEVRDEEGNIGRASTGATAAPSDTGGGCTASGRSVPTGSVAFAVGALLLLAVLRRRRPSYALAAVGMLAATNQGCGCGSDGGHDDETSPKPICGASCDQPCRTDLGKGVPGAYLSIARGDDGALWAAGYNDGLQNGSDVLPFGDLVVGRVDLATKSVDWKTVDGLPARSTATDGCTLYDPAGWRSGETGPGDDVGRFASIGVTSKNQPIVTYYDDTNHRLKLAIDDGGWTTAVLREQAGADVGRASKLLVVDGKPVVTFMQTEPGSNGHLRAKVVLAKATTSSPHDAGDFTFVDIAVQEDAEAPLAPATYPRALGAYLGFANGPDGLGVIAYDGAHDQLVRLSPGAADAWTQTVLGAGGISPSLAIASDGTWHMAYRSGDTLRYRIDGAEETVDDGATPDGLHEVGSDAVLRLDDGVASIYYADSTALALRRAVKNGGAWSLTDVPSPDRWTTFPQFLPGEDASKVAAWWRASDRATTTVTGNVAVLP